MSIALTIALVFAGIIILICSVIGMIKAVSTVFSDFPDMRFLDSKKKGPSDEHIDS